MVEALNFINNYSPEHLEIMTDNPLHVLKKVKNAGSIFLGKYSPSTTGCYAAGVNHIIPTGGGAKRNSPLSVTDFIKKLDITFLNKEGLEKLYDTIKSLAQYEGFPQHFKAVEARFKKA